MIFFIFSNAKTKQSRRFWQVHGEIWTHIIILNLETSDDLSKLFYLELSAILCLPIWSWWSFNANAYRVLQIIMYCHMLVTRHWVWINNWIYFMANHFIETILHTLHKYSFPTLHTEDIWIKIYSFLWMLYSFVIYSSCK